MGESRKFISVTGKGPVAYISESENFGSLRTAKEVDAAGRTKHQSPLAARGRRPK